MLRRMYVDNFLTFVGLDLEVGSRQLLLGRNGTGKTTVLRSLRIVREFVEGGQKSRHLFSGNWLTRWQVRPTQHFELDVDLADLGTVRYTLVVNFADRWARVERETLHADGRPLFEHVRGTVRLYRDDHSLDAEFPLDLEQSVLGTIGPRADRSRLTAFRRWLSEMYLLRIDSPHIATLAPPGLPQTLADDASDFPIWYRDAVLSDQATAGELRSKLAEVLPGFVSLDLRTDGGDAAVLSARFDVGGQRLGNGRSPSVSYSFRELSDGQRSLIVLYALVYFGLRAGRTVCLDQPDEYLAMEEIQPWLLFALDEVELGTGQLIVVSHDAELVNVLAPQYGLWFERPAGTGTRVRPFAALSGSPLSAAEQVARGENNADG